MTTRFAWSRGFTLIELMVAMALMVILTMMLAAFVANAQKIYNSATAQAQVMSSARTALQVMRRDLSNISSTVVTTALPIPSDQNFTLDNGPISESTGALVLRSLGYVPSAHWAGDGAMSEPGWDGYSTLTPSQAPQPFQADPGVRERAFLQFFATTRYYNPTPSFGMPRFEQRPVLVQYYLRKRQPVDGYEMPGAYLMRRIQPYNIQIESDGSLNFNGWGQPIEDDICGFVRGVRVYYYDRDREVLGASGEDARFIEALSPTDPNSTTPPTDIWTEAGGISSLSGRGAVVFWIEREWVTWLDPTLAQAAPDFSKRMFLPPSIMIGLLVCSSNGYTYREVKETFHLPTAPNQIPVNPFK